MLWIGMSSSSVACAAISAWPITWPPYTPRAPAGVHSDLLQRTVTAGHAVSGRVRTPRARPTAAHLRNRFLSISSSSRPMLSTTARSPGAGADTARVAMLSVRWPTRGVCGQRSRTRVARNIVHVHTHAATHRQIFGQGAGDGGRQACGLHVSCVCGTSGRGVGRLARALPFGARPCDTCRMLGIYTPAARTSRRRRTRTLAQGAFALTLE